MIDDQSYSRMVKAHEKSIVLGGASVLHPIATEDAERFANILRRTILVAERAAYRRGRDDAQAAIRDAIGLPRRR